ATQRLTHRNRGDAVEWHPLGRVVLVRETDLAAARAAVEGDTDGFLARRPAIIVERVHGPHDLHVESGLFARLAPHRIHRFFAGLHASAAALPLAGGVFAIRAAADHQQAAVALDQ